MLHNASVSLIGLFAQELAFTHPELRSVCNDMFTRITTDFTKDLTAAKAIYAPDASFEPARIAWGRRRSGGRFS